MTFNQYRENEQRSNRLLVEQRALEEQNARIASTHEFKDALIKELQKEIADLKRELAPIRKREEQQRFDEYASQKCTDKYGCSCPICRGL